MGKWLKYTDNDICNAVSLSISVTDVMRILGIKMAGGSHAHISKRIRDAGFNTDHFLGQAYNRGKIFYGRNLTADQILVEDRFNGRKDDVCKLRRAMGDVGIPSICGICEIGPVWMNEPLTLQIDHKNGNPLDNRVGNLRFLCPNCHSQTYNFNGKSNRYKVVTHAIRADITQWVE